MQVHTDWLLTSERAALHLPTATAVIADLHMGYGAVRCCSGEALPVFSLDDIIGALQSLLNGHDMRRLVIAGDLFEDADPRLSAEDLRDWLDDSGVELAGIVPGNHDRDILNDSRDLPVCPDGVLLGDWLVIHGDRPRPPGRIIQGHIHPYFRWNEEITAPCYLVSPDRLILPAFSEDAAGINVLRGPSWRNYRCCVIAGEEVFDFGEVAALQRRQRKKTRRKS
jgi:putative SbcD/Mre11-related phosphoesterase